MSDPRPPVDEATVGWYNRTFDTRYLVPTRKGRRTMLMAGLGTMAIAGLVMGTVALIPKRTVLDETFEVDAASRFVSGEFDAGAQQLLTMTFDAPQEIDICVGPADQRRAFEKGIEPLCTTSSTYRSGSHGSMVGSTGPQVVMIHNSQDEPLEVHVTVTLRGAVASFVFIGGLVLVFLGLFPAIISQMRIWKGKR